MADELESFKSATVFSSLRRCRHRPQATFAGHTAGGGLANSGNLGGRYRALRVALTRFNPNLLVPGRKTWRNSPLEKAGKSGL